jgi:hypothetical protein
MKRKCLIVFANQGSRHLVISLTSAAFEAV